MDTNKPNEIEKPLNKATKLTIKTFFLKPTKKLLQKIEKARTAVEEKKLNKLHIKLNKAIIQLSEIYDILGEKGEILDKYEIEDLPLEESIEIMTDLCEDLQTKV